MLLKLVFFTFLRRIYLHLAGVCFSRDVSGGVFSWGLNLLVRQRRWIAAKIRGKIFKIAFLVLMHKSVTLREKLPQQVVIIVRFGC